MRKDDVSGGGARATGGTYTVTGTAGQAEAAVQSGGRYRLTGGVHGPRGDADRLFCDSFDYAPCR